MIQTIEIIANILMLVTAALLVIVILIQNPKSSGLGSAFGNSTTALGKARGKAGKEIKLQKLTVAFAVTLGVLAVLMLILSGISRLKA